MNKLIYAIALNFSVFIISTFLLSACGGSGGDTASPGDGSGEIGSTGGTVTTVDKKASITIPAGAISTPTSITIKRLDQQTVNTLFGDVATPAVAYELGPDGLDFGMTPATFSFTLDDSFAIEANGDVTAKTIAAVHVASDGMVNEINNLQIEYDEQTGVLTATGEVTHFSKLEFVFLGHLAIKAKNVPDELEVGKTFEATVTVSKSLEFFNAEISLYPKTWTFQRYRYSRVLMVISPTQMGCGQKKILIAA